MELVGIWHWVGLVFGDHTIEYLMGFENGYLSVSYDGSMDSYEGGNWQSAVIDNDWWEKVYG